MERIKDLITFKLNHYTRSLIILAILAVAAIFIIIASSRLSPEYTISRIFISEDRFDSLTKYNLPSSMPITTEIYIGDEKLIYDGADNSFYFSHTEGTDFGKKRLYIKTNSSYKEVLRGNYIRAAILNNDDPQLILYNKDTISTSRLVITTLPIMNITISADTVQELELDDTYNILEDAPGSMSLYDNSDVFDSGKRTTSSALKIHRRGGTTVDFPQKSYRITLLDSTKNFGKTKKANLLGLREDDDWILYSAYSDYEKIRNAFSMNLWQQMSAGNNEWHAAVSNEYRYIELFFNGRYHGLYLLTYPIDGKSFSLSSGETLFKKSDWSETEYSLDLEPLYPDEPDNLWLPGYSIKKGSDLSYSTLHQLYYNLAYSADPYTIRESVDINNSIDLWLFYKLTQAVDNVYGTGVKNLFTATKLSDNGYDGYKLLFSPWDMDQTWGNRFVDGEGKNGIYPYWNPIDYDLPMDWGTVPFLMNSGDAEIISQVKDRYFSLRNTVLSNDNLSLMIDEYQADIYDSGAFERTMNRWPDGNYSSAEIKLTDFKTYVLERMKYMDSYISSL